MVSRFAFLRRLLATVVTTGLTAPIFVPSTALAASAPDGGANPSPAVAPALREWTGGTGEFTLLPQSRIVAADARLTGEAHTLARDVESLTGRLLPVVQDDAHGGDIVLGLDPSAPQHEEGYRLAITDRVTVEARTPTGVSRGTQTVAQLLARDEQRVALPRGTATDWPQVDQRGFMLDAGRKYYEPSYIEQQIRTAAWYKLNTVHLHLTEWNAFRLASPKFPGLAAAQSYTRDDIARFEALAAKYHVTLVPEIDLPAHASAVAAQWPETKWDCSSMNGSPWSNQDGFTLDVTKPRTREVVKDLLDEFIPWFRGPEFHIGTDEYPYQDKQEQCPQLVQYARDNGFATTPDVMVDFINWMDSVVRDNGKRTVIWNWWDVNQSPTKEPNKDIKVEAWTGDAKPYLDKGYEVVASPSNLLYVTPQGAPGGALVPDNTLLYGQWQPNDHPRLAGYMISRWSDGAEGASDAYHDWFAHRAQQVLADRAWGGPRLSSNVDYENVADRIGPAPGVRDTYAAASPDAVRLTGTPYGTSPAWGDSDSTFDKVYDGNPATFFDYSQADGAYAGIDLGRAKPVEKIRFLPRGQAANHVSRMTGGRFQGCVDGPAEGCVDLATVAWRPPGYDWIQLTVDDARPYRWLRYLAPNGGYGNVAEVEFWGAPSREATVDIDAPDTVALLGTTTVRTTVTNITDRPIHDLSVALTVAPTEGGYPIEARIAGPGGVRSLPPGATHTVTWSLTPPLGTAPGIYRLSAQANWRSGSPFDGRSRASARTLAHLPAALEVAFDRPALVVDGAPATATMRLTSHAGLPVQLRWSAQVPAGITVTPASGESTLQPGKVLAIPLSVTAEGIPGVRRLVVDGTVSAGGSTLALPSAALDVSVPYTQLDQAFDNVGTTTDENVSPPGLGGGVDGDGSSYSAQALAAVGATPGSTVSHGGLDFTWPSAAPGTPDNILANGQVIKVGAAGSRLGFLTVGTYSTRVGGQGTVTYTDGTTQSFEMYDSDWQGTAPAGADVALQMPYHNLSNVGRVTKPTFVFFHGVEIDPTKTVATVVLPRVGSTATGGTPALHVWSMTID